MIPKCCDNAVDYRLIDRAGARHVEQLTSTVHDLRARSGATPDFHPLAIEGSVSEGQQRRPLRERLV
jgi:hypothetical protein